MNAEKFTQKTIETINTAQALSLIHIYNSDSPADILRRPGG